MTGLMMPVITLLEVAAGLFSALGIFWILLFSDPSIGLIGAQLSCLSITSLFFGQRLAQDYEGAATLTTYFIITVISIYLLWN